MNKNKIFQKIQRNSLFRKITRSHTKSMQLSDIDEESEVVMIDKIGILESGQGIVILKTSEDKVFPISSFSLETAKNIANFQDGNRSEIPSLYNMIEQICEESGLLLVKVRIFSNGKALRANLYFSGRKELILRNYRASDAIGLATFYNIPILIKKDLIQQHSEIRY